jgi:hypothetical protein
VIFKRITSTMIEIDGETYIKYVSKVEPARDLKAHILSVLSRFGSMTKGVLANRCRKWDASDIEGAVSELMASGSVECECTVHAKTFAPVYHFRLTGP